MSITKVTFRKWPDGSIDALMPYEVEFNYLVTCYSRVGQHSQADYDLVVSKTKLANQSEYSSLLAELNQFGYEIKVIKKVNRSKMVSLQRDLKQVFKP